MDQPEQDILSKNPTELLQEQVLLLRQVNAALTHLQDRQARMHESLARMSAVSRRSTAEAMDVFVTNINMPFWSMVGFILKWSIAAIPAGILFLIIGVLAWIVIAAVFGGAMWGLNSFFGP
jgi:hypothetical protein